jgi:hypothetical protein
MTSERAQAYGRVVKTVEDIGSSKLLESETQRVRAACDALFFCEDVAADQAAREAVEDVTDLHRHLIDSGRWLEETADALLDDVLACGPVAPVAS